MPHLGHDKEKAGMPPKGCMVMWVGQEGEEQERFVVPVVYLNHPLFAKLLEDAEKEYGFDQKGAIVIPCGVDHFRHVQDLIDREGGAAACAAAAAGGGHRHGDHHHHRQHGHHHLPHFAACFGA
ncbi:Auxin responsive protein [Musa troglodytarum]|uniref:Auxin responsive protein n=1 Tax=Musa troglodytarum TaxID=320322 RepID=A0A9E7FN05_9LILI|nr:Auxin responsive protein [Musa troglodytarum]